MITKEGWGHNLDNIWYFYQYMVVKNGQQLPLTLVLVTNTLNAHTKNEW